MCVLFNNERYLEFSQSFVQHSMLHQLDAPN